jgi:hypothetical protein
MVLATVDNVGFNILRTNSHLIVAIANFKFRRNI